MGVMRCSRGDCENIMCDRHSVAYGYICNECFDELVKTGFTDMERFMASDKPKHKIDFYEIYNDMFPRI